MKKTKDTCLINRKLVDNTIRERKADIHKGDCGRILIIAGSKGMAGAAALCAKSALRSGAGLVQISAPEELFPILQIKVTEATCIDRHKEIDDINKYDAIGIGPGLGDDKESLQLIQKVLTEYEGTVVLDADALNMIAKYDLYAQLKAGTCRTVITPHIGEARRLLGVDRDYRAEREEMAEELVAATGSVVLLKGAGTIVTSEGDKSYINTTGNPGMATGGSGDVLTGIITSLAGQGYTPVEAAFMGAYIHGLAGDMAKKRFGEWGLIAGDIAETTSLAIRDILENR